MKVISGSCIKEKEDKGKEERKEVRKITYIEEIWNY